jgi:hypothetical protein
MSSSSSGDPNPAFTSLTSSVDSNADSHVRERVAELVGRILARYWIRMQTAHPKSDNVDTTRVDGKRS